MDSFPRARVVRVYRARDAVLSALVGLFLFVVPAGGQQSGVVQGRVLDRETGAPLSGVSVVVTGIQRGAVTDAEGRFRIAPVPVGEQQIVAQRVGFGTERRLVDIEPGATITLEIQLSEQAVLLPEVVVSATREAQRLSETAATVGVVSSEEQPRWFLARADGAEGLERIEGAGEPGALPAVAAVDGSATVTWLDEGAVRARRMEGGDVH